MFDSWSRPKFYTKCKPALKHVMTRLELVKKKRLAVEKFMKTDIADLIKGGLDYKAYLKADMLLVEQKITVCYDLVEQFCSCILDHLSDMVKESCRECPEECREAVASLVYAAARFADLPELRQLRSLFIGRYGNSLEAFANKELVDKLKANPSSKDTKLNLMQDVAQEFSVDWDSKALEQKLFTPPQPQQVHPLHKSPQLPTVETNRSSLNNKLHNKVPKRDTPACNELTENIVKLHGKEDNEAITEPRRVSGTEQVNQQKTSSTSGGYRSLPPPYTKPKPTSSEEPSNNVDAEEKKPCSVVPKARSVRTRGRRSLHPGDNTDHQGDEEERIVDRLLQHYSKKKSNPEETWMRHRATKSMSVAGESSGRSERKGHGRASSVDMGGHVHHNLPEYDGLAARVAALRGI